MQTSRRTDCKQQFSACRLCRVEHPLTAPRPAPPTWLAGCPAYPAPAAPFAAFPPPCAAFGSGGARPSQTGAAPLWQQPTPGPDPKPTPLAPPAPPQFPEIGVPQRLTRAEALVRVVGQQLADEVLGCGVGWGGVGWGWGGVGQAPEGRSRPRLEPLAAAPHAAPGRRDEAGRPARLAVRRAVRQQLGHAGPLLRREVEARVLAAPLELCEQRRRRRAQHAVDLLDLRGRVGRCRVVERWLCAGAVI
jgi:hypothetical protein